MPYALYPIPYTLYLISSTLCPIPYTVYPIPYTLYPIPYTLIPYTLIPYTLTLLTCQKRATTMGATTSLLRRKVRLWLAMWFAMTLITVGGFYTLRLVGDVSVESVNWFVLTMYMLPLRWLPSFALGVVCYYLACCVRGDTNNTTTSGSGSGSGCNVNTRLVSLATDLTSGFFLLGTLSFWRAHDKLVYDLEGGPYHSSTRILNPKP
jgi:hypothetical protein